VPGANGFIDPCLPTRADKPPIADGGVHEIKHDGFRLQNPDPQGPGGPLHRL
jgi:ATP-dependent DNA ligase